MPDTILTPQQLQTFEDRGVLRIEALLPPDVCAAACAYVHRRVEPLGYWRDGAWSLPEVSQRPRWPERNTKTSKVVGNKHPTVEALVEQPAFRAVLDVLMDGRPSDRRLHARPQLLFTLPNQPPWTLPNGWHADGPRLASGGCPGVQMFACLDHVGPRGGGTLLVAGSHKLFDFGRVIRGKEFNRLLREDPFFRELLAAEGQVWEADRPLPRGRSGGLDFEVMECCGAPGDVYMVDARVLHTGSPNVLERPRMMATDRFFSREVVNELATAFGWDKRPAS